MSLNLKEIRDRLLEAVDKAITEGSWETSLFFKNIKKQLLEIREFIVTELAEEGEETPTATIDPDHHTHALEEREGYERVYVTLYQTDSARLERWLSTIKMLTGGHSVSRPAYRNEADVEEVIRIKQSKSDAYVMVWVKQSDIIPSYSGAPLKDKWQHELLTLKEGGIKLENIIEFRHDGKTYHLRGDTLVLHHK